MLELTDLHCHILPAMDDGSPDWETSVEMAKMAFAMGVTTIAATPHSNVHNGDLNARCRVIRHRTAELSAALEKAGVPVKVLCGMELFVRSNLKKVLDERSYLTIGGTDYLLTEFDFGEDGEFIEDALFYIKERGLRPILAHPERYAAIQKNPDTAARLFEHGILIQVNKGSLLGRFGKGPYMAADWILGHGLAHLVASDAHGTERRTPSMAEVFEFIEENYSEEYAEILLAKNPNRIAAGERVLSPDEF